MPSIDIGHSTVAAGATGTTSLVLAEIAAGASVDTEHLAVAAAVTVAGMVYRLVSRWLDQLVAVIPMPERTLDPPAAAPDRSA